MPGFDSLPELGGRFGYIFFFGFLIGGREGAVRGARKGGGRFFIEIPGGGALPGGVGEGAGRVSAGNLGGGLVFFWQIQVGPKSQRGKRTVTVKGVVEN